VPEGFIAAFGAALVDRDADRDLLTQVLTLPGETYLGEQQEVVDVDAIHAVRQGVRRTLAEALRPQLLDTYRACAETGDYDLEPTSIGRRALKNLCLGYLMQLDDPEPLALCQAQLDADHNMTDVIAALSLLADRDCPQREAALEAFAERWRDDPLVMDKWFTIQATSSLPDTLERVEALLGHPAFSLRNPNKVRSLIGAFSAGNPVRFHAAEGAGYRFLADRVLELDPMNPQVAARLVRGLARWRRFDGGRQQLMQAALQRILAAPKVSRDLFEIASKSLEAA
jgi:aminopeptidase N